VDVARLARLPGVAQAAAAARDSVDVVLRQPSLRRRAAAVASASAISGATASTLLDGGDPEREDDPLWQGALRVNREAPGLAELWGRAPLQVLARLHVLAAADLAPAEMLGRPADGVASRRLTAMVRDLAAARRLAEPPPAVVLAAVVHAEVAEAFSPGGGLVGRAAERVVLTATGLDPSSLLVPEVGHLAEQEGYAAERHAFLRGGQVGTARWVERCCRAYTRGAEQTVVLAESPAGSDAG
jgi:hypothetical protein